MERCGGIMQAWMRVEIVVCGGTICSTPFSFRASGKKKGIMYVVTKLLTHGGWRLEVLPPVLTSKH